MTDHQPNSQLTLYRGWPTKGQHVWSPFVIKLEARLRFARVSYNTAGGSPTTAPKGKIPYVEIPARAEGDVTTKMGDSTLVIKHLVETGVLPDLNGRLLAEDRARDLGMRALLEDRLYFMHTRERWIDNYYPMRDHALSSIPWPIRVVVGQMVYRTTKAMLHGQGTLRFTSDEIYASKREIWKTISDALISARSKNESEVERGARPRPFWFLGGSEPTEADGCLFGFIVSVFLCTAAPESRAIVKEYPVLFEYADIIHDSFFPDYEKWPSF